MNLCHGGFIVIAGPTLRTAGIVRCGGCEETMSNNAIAREYHRERCAELRKLDDLAERAIRRKHRKVIW